MKNFRDDLRFINGVRILTKFGCTDKDIETIVNNWMDPVRKYHTLEYHLMEILDLIDRRLERHPSDYMHQALVLCAFFHDAVYDPRAKDNEEKSAELFKSMCHAISGDLSNLVYDMILDTKDHTKPGSSHCSDVFLSFDLHGLTHGTLSRMIHDEKLIFKEFGFVDFNTYKINRSKLLHKFEKTILEKNPSSKISSYIDWCDNVNSPKIAVYSGSFNPFHVGHLDILMKAEKMFDKVIVQIGKNPEKSGDLTSRVAAIEKLLPNNQVIVYDGLLANLENHLGYPITIVKGIRNEDDLKFEKMQLRFTEDYNPDVKMCFIVGDRKFEHVSSSAIRQLTSFTQVENYIP